MKKEDIRDVIREIVRFIKTPIISISGESGLGKTTLAQQLMGSLLSNTNNTCVWIQASEKFSKTRFKTLFPNNYLELLERIFIAPAYGVFQSYDEQSKFFQKVHKGIAMLPPNTKYLIIDNISHHLRYEVLKSAEIGSASSILNNFFEEYLSSLLFFCQIHSIFLILLHEITYNPTKDQKEKFYNTLYSRLDSAEIILERKELSKTQFLTLQVRDQIRQFQYEITQEGITIRNP